MKINENQQKSIKIREKHKSSVRINGNQPHQVKEEIIRMHHWPIYPSYSKDILYQ